MNAGHWNSDQMQLLLAITSDSGGETQIGAACRDLPLPEGVCNNSNFTVYWICSSI